MSLQDDIIPMVEPHLSCWQRFKATVKTITVEPAAFFYTLGLSVQIIISQNLMIDRVCLVHYSYNNTVCGNLHEYDQQQNKVQSYVNVLSMYEKIIQSIPMILFSLFLGSWSDKHGRKLPMILPLTGNLIAEAIYILCYFIHSLPPEYLLFTSVYTFTGGIVSFLLGMYSYISDLSRVKARTTRMAFLDLFLFSSMPLGLYTGGVLFQTGGYFAVFLVSTFSFLSSLLYLIHVVKDTRGKNSPYHAQLVENDEVVRNGNICSQLFDINNVKITFKTCFRKREGNKRVIILLLMLTMCLDVFSYGEPAYLYTRKKFGWEEQDYTYYMTYKMLISGVGTFLAMPVLSFWLQVHDGMLGILGSLCCITRTVVIAVANQDWLMYFASAVSFLSGLSLIVVRSLMSKCAAEGEHGRVFSLLASFEATMPVISSSIFTVVYNSTIDEFLGSVYLLMSGLYGINLLIFIYIFCTYSQDQKKSKDSNILED